MDFTVNWRHRRLSQGNGLFIMRQSTYVMEGQSMSTTAICQVSCACSEWEESYNFYTAFVFGGKFNSDSAGLYDFIEREREREREREIDIYICVCV